MDDQENYDICGDFANPFWIGSALDSMIERSVEKAEIKSNEVDLEFASEKSPTKASRARKASPPPPSNDDAGNSSTTAPKNKPKTRKTRENVEKQPATRRRSARLQTTTEPSVTAPDPQPQPQAPPNNQRGRARRNYIAEIAARSTVVDCIDLISSPVVPISGVVPVDTDDEVESDTVGNGIVKVLDSSFDFDNPEISVKVKWNNKIETFQHRKYQPFGDLMKVLADREKTDISHVLLNLKETIIKPDDTPDALNYKIFDFIAGRVVSEKVTARMVTKRDANSIELRLQSDKWKEPLPINLGKTQLFKILYLKCAEALSIPVEKVKLSFDGEVLNADETPNDLDLDGGELIDCKITNK